MSFSSQKPMFYMRSKGVNGKTCAQMTSNVYMQPYAILTSNHVFLLGEQDLLQFKVRFISLKLDLVVLLPAYVIFQSMMCHA